MGVDQIKTKMCLGWDIVVSPLLSCRGVFRDNQNFCYVRSDHSEEVP